eukprot:evm.model.NODE_39505_length_72863_cov_22.203917.4
MGSLTDDELQKLFTWVDTIPLSRAKRNINRDFSDGVLAAEVIAYYFPRLVDVHNYTASSNTAQKLANWRTLNTKVLKKLKYVQTPVMLDDLAQAKVEAAEVFLHSLQYKLARYKAEKSNSNNSTSTANNSNISSSGSISHADDDVHYLPTFGRLSPVMASPRGGGSPGSRFASGTSPSSLASHPSLVRRPFGPLDNSPSAQTSSPIPSSLFSDALSFSAAAAATAAPGMDDIRQQQPARGPLGGMDSAGHPQHKKQPSVDEEILLEKEETLQEMRETNGSPFPSSLPPPFPQTVEILDLKVAKLEQLLRVKDVKIQTLSNEVARLTLVVNSSSGISSSSTSSSSSSGSSRKVAVSGVVTGGGSLL